MEKSINVLDKEVILTGFGDEQNTFLEIGKCNFTESLSIVGLKINFVKLSPNSTSPVENVELIEKGKTLLFSYKPYPIPASSIVKSHIYWNQEFNIENADFRIYNLFGFELNNQNVSIKKIEGFSGILSWDCSGVQAGIYFLRISLAGETYMIPISVNR